MCSCETSHNRNTNKTSFPKQFHLDEALLIKVVGINVAIFDVSLLNIELFQYCTI